MEELVRCEKEAHVRYNLPECGAEASEVTPCSLRRLNGGKTTQEAGVDAFSALGGETGSEKVKRICGCGCDATCTRAGDERFDAARKTVLGSQLGLDLRKRSVGNELDAAIADVEGFSWDIAFP